MIAPIYLQDLCSSAGYVRPDLLNKADGGMSAAVNPLLDYHHVEKDVKVEMFLMPHVDASAERWWINRLRGLTNNAL